MVVRPLPQPLPTPRRRPPLTIEGRLIYAPGPWGIKRGVRRVTVELRARDKRFPGVTSGYAEAVTDDDGKFRIVTHAGIDPNEHKLHLHIRPHYSPPFDHDIEREVSVNDPMPQQLFTLTVTFKPPLPDLARLNGQSFPDTKSWAQALCRILQKPSYPVVITLMREAVDVTYRTYAEQLFAGLSPGSLPADFAARVRRELANVPWMSVSGSSDAAALEVMLTRLAFVSADELHNGKLLPGLIKGLGAALNAYVTAFPVNDPTTDMAAACTLLLIAGLLAKDGAKTTATFGSLVEQRRPLDKYVAIFVSITR